MTDPVAMLEDHFKQVDTIMEEYKALIQALIESEQEHEPTLTWAQAHERARTRYQRHLRR
jgi:hypothetical protein